MAAKRRPSSKKPQRRAPAASKRKSSKARRASAGPGDLPKLSAPYARPRAAGLHPVPANFVGAIVDSLIRNDGARDIDVRGRNDGLFDVTRLD